MICDLRFAFWKSFPDLSSGLRLAALALLLSTLIPPFSTSFAQGSLTPPGPPAPTMKSLDQIEPRTPISAAPFTITQPGSYYLTTNLAVSSGNAISIATNDVYLDLRGFALTSTEASPTGSGIVIGGVRNLTIVNGSIEGGVTNDGTGAYSGPGFANGIQYTSAVPVNVRVTGVLVAGCQLSGIGLSPGSSVIVESCTVRTVGFCGIEASVVKECTAEDCGEFAIIADQVSDCRGVTTTAGTAIIAHYNAQNCYAKNPLGDGIDAGNAFNCFGQSEGTGVGISADTVMNCWGYSSNYFGIFTSYTAENSYGQSLNSDGLYSGGSALNCYGRSTSGGYALYAAFLAENCIGFNSGEGDGIYATVAANSYGFSSAGLGIQAFMASACHGATTTGTALVLTHNVNSF